MKTIDGIGLSDVQAVYAGPEGELWELVMGQQVHVGGLASSMAARMTGVDATPAVIARGRQRNQAEGLADKIDFVHADVCATGLPAAQADFVWGEDAWCYVVDKPALIAEAVRLVKPGGVIAFTDWIEGAKGLSDEQARRFLKFMKFANVQDLDGYAALLSGQGCTVEHAADTGRFAPAIDLYINMLTQQLTYDALRIIGFDMPLMAALGGEMEFVRQMAHEGRIAQGLFVARKNHE
ncbi:MAG: class I SAM-dependent methyltransferase [Planctomycetota bacterium]|nr:class I SAM-dependent methyltransferase [Planctomycetota bacterium]